MSVIYIVLPLAVLLAAAALAGFVWAVRRGQFDDLDTPAIRVALEEDEGEGLGCEAAGNRQQATGNRQQATVGSRGSAIGY